LCRLETLDGLEQFWTRIHSLENKVVKWRDLHRVLEAAIDRCEEAANVIEMVDVKQG
jgi:uncharacterized protein Yka (UPF0111/DUF47 family)